MEEWTVSYGGHATVTGVRALDALLDIAPDYGTPGGDTQYLSVGPGGRAATLYLGPDGAVEGEFDGRHVVPMSVARQVVREFCATGVRPDSIEWEVLFF